MTASDLEPTRCPLCRSQNACGMAAGATTCWCFSVDIPAAVLDRIPAEARLKACVCRRCALASDASARAPREQLNEPAGE